MNGYEKAIMDIVKPVMNYLEKNFPKEHFITCMSYNTKKNDISTIVTVKEEKEDKTYADVKEEKEDKTYADVCAITDSAIYGLDYTLSDCKLLNYNKLMELVQSTGIDADTLFSMKLSGNMPNHLRTNRSH